MLSVPECLSWGEQPVSVSRVHQPPCLQGGFFAGTFATDELERDCGKVEVSAAFFFANFAENVACAGVARRIVV